MMVILFKTISTRTGPSWMASETDALSLCRGIILALYQFGTIEQLLIL